MDKTTPFYRLEIVDGPSRMGSIEIGSARLPLPLIIDREVTLEGPIPSLKCFSIGEGWPDRKLELVRDETASGPWEVPIVDHMVSQGIGSLKGAVELKRSKLLADGVPLPASVISLVDLLSKDTRALANVLASAREGRASQPLFLTGAVDGRNLEALFYLGVEILDTSCAHSDASKGQYYTLNGVEDHDLIRDRLGTDVMCGCPSCSGGTMDPQALGRHNVAMMHRRLKICVHRLKQGCLREHVMGQISGKPDMGSLIRRFETGAFPDLLKFAHTFRKSALRPVTYRDDIRDPDFQLWKRRIEEDYCPPPLRKVLLLLPCSARKPYSLSRTHQRIRAQLSGVKGWVQACQQLILTSPLGAVPAELDALYPAAYYDIPVTGEWYPEEIERMRDLVGSIISAGDYGNVVCHHQEGDLIFKEEATSGSILGRPFILEKDLRSLSQRLREIIGDDIGPGRDRSSDMVSLLNFALGARMPWDTRITLRSIRDRTLLFIGRVHIAELRPGGPVPTLEGGRMIWDSGAGRRVIIDDFSPKGTVFAQGIKGSDESIHPGDIVLVGTRDGYRGVGRAILPGGIMASGIRGPAVAMISHMR